MTRTLTREEFFHRGQDMVGFYDLLPTDGRQLDGDSISETEFTAELHRFAHMDLLQLDTAALDEVILYILVRPVQHHIDILRRVSANACIHFTSLLKGNKSNRPLRMRLMQLNYCIQNILDASLALPAATDTALLYRAPWDYLHTPAQEVWITSDEQNVIIDGQKMRLGLPSQVDVLEKNALSIGSIYSEGGWIWENNSATHIGHTLPVVLLWREGVELRAIDYRGTIFAVDKRQTLATLECDEVSKCRHIGDTLYVFDWTTPHQMLAIDANNFTVARIALPDIVMANDIVQVGDAFYLIDKAQGHVFKYDSHFVLQETRLGLGKGIGQLYDPIAIRHEQGKLIILNWLTQKLTTIDVF